MTMPRLVSQWVALSSSVSYLPEFAVPVDVGVTTTHDASSLKQVLSAAQHCPVGVMEPNSYSGR